MILYLKTYYKATIQKPYSTVMKTCKSDQWNSAKMHYVIKRLLTRMEIQYMRKDSVQKTTPGS